MELSKNNAAVFIKNLPKKVKLSDSETRELFVIAQNPKKFGAKVALNARNQIAERNQGFVNMVAQKYKNCGLDFEDLLIEANFGLLRAIEKYDVEKGFCFTTYAKAWIKYELQIAINKQGNAIYLPLRAKTDKKQFSPLSLDANCGDSDNTFSLGNTLVDTREGSASDKYMEKEMQEKILSLLSILNEREKFVIRNIYGFLGEEKSLSKLADHLNLSKEGVRQIKVRAEKKLYNVANQQSLQNYLYNAA